MITFLIFHLDLSTPIKQAILKKNPNFTVFDSDQLITILFESIKKHHEKFAFVIVSDEATQYKIDPQIQIVRYTYPKNELALNKVKALRHFFNTYEPHSDVIFLDPDIIVNGNLEGIFHDNFDIGVTYRKHELIFNAGFLAVSKGSFAKAVSFLTVMQATIENKFPSFVAWWGFQMAMKKKLHPFFHWKEEKVTVDDIVIKFLTGDVYNYTPKSEQELYQQGALANKKVIHFKGFLKPFMPLYWNSIVNSNL